MYIYPLPLKKMFNFQTIALYRNWTTYSQSIQMDNGIHGEMKTDGCKNQNPTRNKDYYNSNSNKNNPKCVIEKWYKYVTIHHCYCRHINKSCYVLFPISLHNTINYFSPIRTEQIWSIWWKFYEGKNIILQRWSDQWIISNVSRFVLEFTSANLRELGLFFRIRMKKMC